jgi:hypothetical protein
VRPTTRATTITTSAPIGTALTSDRNIPAYPSPQCPGDRARLD